MTEKTPINETIVGPVGKGYRVYDMCITQVCVVALAFGSNLCSLECRLTKN